MDLNSFYSHVLHPVSLQLMDDFNHGVYRLFEILILRRSRTSYGLQRAEFCEVWLLHPQHEMEQFPHQSYIDNKGRSKV